MNTARSSVSTAPKISLEGLRGLGLCHSHQHSQAGGRRIDRQGYVSGRPLTGINGRDISAMAAAFYGLPQGILVDSVAPESDAAAKGLLPGIS